MAEKQIDNYIVCGATDLQSLIDEVQRYITEKGAEPIGGILIIKKRKFFFITEHILLQAVITYKPILLT